MAGAGAVGSRVRSLWHVYTAADRLCPQCLYRYEGYSERVGREARRRGRAGDSAGVRGGADGCGGVLAPVRDLGVRPLGGLPTDGANSGGRAAAWGVCDALAAAAEPDWADGGGGSRAQGQSGAGARARHAGRHADTRFEAVYVEYSGGEAAAGMAGGGRKSPGMRGQT